MDAIKGTIEDNGYARTGGNSYPYAGALVTAYQKKIARDGNNSAKIRIMLHFKRGSDNDTCVNFGIIIANPSKPDLPVTKAEIDRIEAMLYQKLLKTRDGGGIERGNR